MLAGILLNLPAAAVTTGPSSGMHRLEPYIRPPIIYDPDDNLADLLREDEELIEILLAAVRLRLI